MKISRPLLIILVLLIIILVIMYFLLGMFLKWAAWKAIRYVSYHLGERGMVIKDPDFNNVGVGFPLSFYIRDFSANMVLTKHNVFQIDRDFSLTLRRVAIALDSLRKRTFIFSITGGLVALKPERGAAKKTRKKDEYDGVEIVKLEIPFQVNFMRRGIARTQVAALVQEFAEFVKKGLTPLPMRFNGASAFTVRKKRVSGRMLLIPYEKNNKLVMVPKDFLKISETLGERLTESEFAVYCNNPLRMPRMLRIRDDASDKAWQEHEDDPEVPEEAYRHVLWAYNLTKAYDEKFSAEVTDTHEVEPVGESEYDAREYLRQERNKKDLENVIDEKTEAAIEMDLVNNAIGREYALAGYIEDSVLERVMSDRRVIRTPREAFAEEATVKDALLEEARVKAGVKKVTAEAREEAVQEAIAAEKRMLERFGKDEAGSRAGVPAAVDRKDKEKAREGDETATAK